MDGKVNKSESITQRRKTVLRILDACDEGRAEYPLILEALREHGFKAGDKTVRDDCKYLIENGYADKIKRGAAITDKGKVLIGGDGQIEEAVKEKYAKQMVILKLLYDCEMRTNPDQVKGLLPQDIVNLRGIGEIDTVKDILQRMEEEGLVQKDNDRWRLGAGFPKPISEKGETASLLYEYLNTLSGLVPLPPDLAMLKSKLAPLLIIPGRDRWREELAKVAERITVHGRGVGEQQDIHQVMTLVEEAVYNCRVINARYRGRSVELHPLGVVYHWVKGQWYVIAGNPAQKAIVSYALNRFSKVCTGSKTFDKPGNFKMEEFLSNRWGISNDKDLEVKVHFQSTPWNRTALEKLRADVSRRQICNSDCELEDHDDGSIILYDKVAGESEFARWLRSYGDAAQIMEPESLRQAMAKSGSKMLQRYGEGDAAIGQ